MRPALPLAKKRAVGADAVQRQADGGGGGTQMVSSAYSTIGGPGLQVIQREVAASPTTAATEPAPAEETAGGSAGTAGAAQDVNLLAYEVWSLLKARLGYEAERMGRR